jgi:formyltetrahydrofolate-dependent phosphoribosylglycinamide formyltransferase
MVNLAEHIDAGDVNASIELVIASRDCPGVGLSRARGFPTHIVARRDFASESAMHDRISTLLHETRIDLVCLCGYMRWFRVDADFCGRAINIHPALLPEFGGTGLYGDRVHAAVLEARRKVSGCSVHFVDDQYDQGPVIVQRTCPVLPGDDAHTLAARVFEQERKAYPQAVQMIAEGSVRLEGGKVIGAAINAADHPRSARA